MSIASEITRLQGNISDSLTAVANKGVTVPAGSNSDDLAGLIALIQTGGGGGSTTWQTMYDDSTWISSATPNYFIINNYTTPLQQGETYRVTWGTGGTKYVSETFYDNTGTAYDGYVCGNAGLIGGTNTGEPYLLYRDSATRLLGVTNATGGQNIQITIELQTTSGGGGSTLITKTITANGTYNPANDNADGYSSVTVNVPVPPGYIIPSGNKEITANGSNIDVANYATVSVAVPSGGGGKNVQVAHGTKRIATSTYTDVGYEITVGKTGTYNVYWAGWRSSTSGTNGAQLYVNDAESGNAVTTFDSSWTNVQNGSRTNVSLTQGDKVTLRARSRGSSYQMYIFFLSIEEV